MNSSEAKRPKVVLDKEVEVVVEVLTNGMFAPHELPLDFDLEQKYRALAVAVIEALHNLKHETKAA
jgi:hypothetical protein